jgi:hypothetical protein
MARPASGLAEQATSPAARLTGRGAVLGMAVLFIVGLLAAGWSGWTTLAGIFFVLGCALAAWYTRPADLLTVVIAAPLVFSGALIGVETLTASGSLLLSVVAGSVVVLASLAVWLLAGLVLTVIIALPRGLPRCVSAFRRDLRAAPPLPRPSWVPAKPGPGGAASRDKPGPARPGAAGPGPRRPADPQAAVPAPRGPGDIQAGAPGPRGPGSGKPAAPGPKGPGNAKPGSPAPRGPGAAKSAGPDTRTHRPPRAPDGDEAADAR